MDILAESSFREEMKSYFHHALRTKVGKTTHTVYDHYSWQDGQQCFLEEWVASSSLYSTPTVVTEITIAHVVLFLDTRKKRMGTKS